MSWLGKFGRYKPMMTRAQFQRHISGEWTHKRSDDGLHWMQNGDFKTWIDRHGMKCIHDGETGLRARSWLDLAVTLELLPAKTGYR